jgi:hypothetical protein
MALLKVIIFIQSVAPTAGKNYVIFDQGSSGHSGRLTLEVVGAAGIGIARFDFHISTQVLSGQFTYGNKTETILCQT